MSLFSAHGEDSLPLGHLTCRFYLILSTGHAGSSRAVGRAGLGATERSCGPLPWAVTLLSRHLGCWVVEGLGSIVHTHMSQ